MTRPVPAGQWSHAHAQCRDCGTTAEPHYGRGYCEACYRRQHGRAWRRRVRSDETPAEAAERKAAHAAYVRAWRRKNRNKE